MEEMDYLPLKKIFGRIGLLSPNFHSRKSSLPTNIINLSYLPYKRVNSCHHISPNCCWEPSWTTTREAKQVASWHFRCVDWDGWIWNGFATMCLRDLTKTSPLNSSNQDPAILVFLQSLHKAGCHDIVTLALRFVLVGCMYAHLTNCIPEI